jgi:hypothetical protein
MKTKDFLLLGTLGLAGFFVAKYVLTKINSSGERFGLLSRKEIEELYSRVKL